MIQLRKYQEDVVTEGIEKLTQYGYLYLALEMRLGKTLISMDICDKLKASNVLFITVKKAIPSIQKDYNALKPDFKLTVINYESVQKVMSNYDCVILDEAHSLGAFPKPSKRAKEVKKIIDYGQSKVIYLSGTPSIESSAQLFHQLYMAPTHWFRKYKNFYEFFKDWGISKTKRIASGTIIQDYSTLQAEVVEKFLNHAAISLTKKQAEFDYFEPNIIEVYVEMSEESKVAYKSILKDKMYKFPNGSLIIADSTVKEMSKLSQISSGSVICEEDKTELLVSSKINSIINLTRGNKKSVVFYRYKAELIMLQDKLKQATCNVEGWQEASKDSGLVLLLQTKTGSRGIDLSDADLQIYLTLEFSGEVWTQGIDRQAHMNRTKPYDVYVLLSTIEGKDTVDHYVFNAVSKKQDFNSKMFKQLKGKL